MLNKENKQASSFCAFKGTNFFPRKSCKATFNTHTQTHTRIVGKQTHKPKKKQEF